MMVHTTNGGSAGSASRLLRIAIAAALVPLLTAQAPAPPRGRAPIGNPGTLEPVAGAPAGSGIVNGVLHYRGFTADMSIVAQPANVAAVEASLKKQFDIVADCGASPQILAFFRSQKVTLTQGDNDGGGHFRPGSGVSVNAAPQPPQKPIILHEYMHAMHARYLPGGANNPDISKFYANAMKSQSYPAGSYVMKNKAEFFAVTGSLYLWGFVDRPPNNRETLRAKQPYYYEWLGQLFGVKK